MTVGHRIPCYRCPLLTLVRCTCSADSINIHLLISIDPQTTASVAASTSCIERFRCLSTKFLPSKWLLCGDGDAALSRLGFDNRMTKPSCRDRSKVLYKRERKRRFLSKGGGGELTAQQTLKPHRFSTVIDINGYSQLVIFCHLKRVTA